MSFEGKVVLITGASAGIGAEAAFHFAKEGALLSLTGRNAERLEGVVEKIKERGVQEEPLVIVADVTTDAERIISETIEKYERIDVLINNAGSGNFASIETMTMDDYDVIMATNVRAVVQLTQLSVPHLIASKGNIVNTSSSVTYMALKNFLAYSMSKAAVDQFTKNVAMELADKGVRVNSVNPGFIANDFITRSGIVGDDYAAVVDLQTNINPLGRVATNEDVVNAIAFLASDKASFITGHILPVDGFLYMRGPG